LRSFVERVVPSGVRSALWFQHAAKRKLVFLDTPVVMGHELTEIWVDVERVLATVSDDRRLACRMLDHTPNLRGFVEEL
jgi:hypothetical protein